MHGFPGLALFIGIFIVAGMDSRWLVKQTRGRSDLAWANNFGRMLQASLVGFAIGGSFNNLEMFDGFYVLVIMAAAARRIVAAELATQERTLEHPFGGALPATAAAAAHVRLGRPLVRT
jgi:putative inorganic carbon (HCO3(-)) transporter